MKFTKMHGLGNDYIYINTIEEGEYDFSALARVLSDRHFGIGADGIITISDSSKADFFMQIYNADGSKGEMCGNGIRCVGKYVYEKGLINKNHLTIDTLAGIKYLDLHVNDNNKVDMVTVDMGIAMLHDGSKIDINKSSHMLKVNDEEYQVMDISVGNPHTVIFVSDITDDLVLKVGPLIEKHSYYKNRTNVEFVKIIDSSNIEMRVWERGSGETMACGTGACASAMAYFLKTGNNRVTVHLLGGILKINRDLNNGHLLMEGPATKVFDGVIDDDYLTNICKCEKD